LAPIRKSREAANKSLRKKRGLETSVRSTNLSKNGDGGEQGKGRLKCENPGVGGHNPKKMQPKEKSSAPAMRRGTEEGRLVKKASE